MAKLSKLRDRSIPVKIELDDDTLNMRVRIHAITPSMECELADAMGTSASAGILCSMFCKLVVEWDLEGDDGQVLALDPQVIADNLPSDVLLKILEEARKQASPLGN